MNDAKKPVVADSRRRYYFPNIGTLWCNVYGKTLIVHWAGATRFEVYTDDVDSDRFKATVKELLRTYVQELGELPTVDGDAVRSTMAQVEELGVNHFLGTI